MRITYIICVHFTYIFWGQNDPTESLLKPGSSCEQILGPLTSPVPPKQGVAPGGRVSFEAPRW